MSLQHYFAHCMVGFQRNGPGQAEIGECLIMRPTSDETKPDVLHRVSDVSHSRLIIPETRVILGDGFFDEFDSSRQIAIHDSNITQMMIMNAHNH